MRLPVTYLGLGPGALDRISVRGRARLESAQLLVGDEVRRLAAWAPNAERIEARGLSEKEIATRMAAAFMEGRTAVRAVAGTLTESMRALDELRLLLESNVLLEVLGAHPGDTIRWPWRESLPLAGKRIAVTRPRSADDALSDLLARMGAEVVEAPAMELAQASDPGALDRAIDGIHRYGFLVLTSAIGVNAFIDRLLARGKDLRWLAGVKIAVVGPGTGAALRTRGLLADIAPIEFRGEALAQAVAKEMGPGARVLLARAEEGREALPVELAKAGALVDAVAAYRMVAPPKEAFAALEDRLRLGALDAVTFASGAAARNVVTALGPEPFGKVEIACLGPVTADAVRAVGLTPTLVAGSARFEDLVDALAGKLRPPPDGR